MNGRRAKTLLRGFAVLPALLGVFLFLISGGRDGWSALGRGWGLVLLVVSLVAFLAAQGADSRWRGPQVAAFLVTLVYLAFMGYWFVNAVSFGLAKPSLPALALVLVTGAVTAGLLTAAASAGNVLLGRGN